MLISFNLSRMDSKITKYDDFRRAVNKPGQWKIRFSTSSSLLVLCTAPSELVKNLSATHPEDNGSTNRGISQQQRNLHYMLNQTLATEKHTTLPILY